MGLPKKIFFTVKELAEHSWCGFSSEDEIINGGAAGLISIHVFANGVYSLAELDKYNADIKNGIEANTPISYDQCPLRVPSITLLSLLKPGANHATVACFFDSAEKVLLGEEKILVPWSFENNIFMPIPLTREDLFVTRESIEKFETEYPELKRDQDHNEQEAQNTKQCADVLPNPPGSKILSGWKEIAKHADMSISTAKRKFKGAECIKDEERTRKVFTTTAALADWRLNNAIGKKKNKRGAK